jgi:alpha-ketoglutarate-dependent taurine dioxygenase
MPSVVEPRSWNEVPTVTSAGPADELLSVDTGLITSLFKTYGVVLFRSFVVGIDRFQALAGQYSFAQVRYPSDLRRPVSEDRSVQTVDVTMDAIPLHSELSHTPFRPDICWFHCVRAPADGGETTLCDGSLLSSALPHATRDLLAGRMLRYRRRTSVSFLYRMLGTSDAAAIQQFLEGADGKYYRVRGSEVSQNFVCPVFDTPKYLNEPVFANNIIHNDRPGKALRYPTLEDGTTIPSQAIASIRDAAKSCTFDIHWEDGDLLMFDNTRFMHGRRRIIGPDRVIWTQFSCASL